MSIKGFVVGAGFTLAVACGQPSRQTASEPQPNAESAFRSAVQRFHDALTNADTTVIAEIVAPNATFIRQGRLEPVRELVFAHGPTLAGAHGQTGAWTIKEIHVLDQIAYAITEPRSTASGSAAYGLTVWRWNRRWQIVSGHWSHQ